MSWLSDIFNPIGDAISSVAKPVLSGLSSVASPILGTLGSAASGIAPMAGTLLGSRFGPMGAQLGGMLGGALGNALGGNQQQPSQSPYASQVPMGELPSYGALQAGNTLSNQIPQKYASMNMGQFGGEMGRNLMQNAGSFIANRYQMPQQSFGDMANSFGKYAQNTFNRYAPSWMQGAGQGIGQGISNFMQRGMGEFANQSPYSMMQQLPEHMGRYGQEYGERAGNYVDQRMPQDMQGMQLSDMPNYAAMRGSQMMQNKFAPRIPQEFRNRTFNELPSAANEFMQNRFQGPQAAPQVQGQFARGGRVDPMQRYQRLLEESQYLPAMA